MKSLCDEILLCKMKSAVWQNDIPSVTIVTSPLDIQGATFAHCVRGFLGKGGKIRKNLSPSLCSGHSLLARSFLSLRSVKYYP